MVSPETLLDMIKSAKALNVRPDGSTGQHICPNDFAVLGNPAYILLTLGEQPPPEDNSQAQITAVVAALGLATIEPPASP